MELNITFLYVKIGDSYMKKTICKNWEVNYKCVSCGQSIMNATKVEVICDTCGNKFK